MRLSRTNTALVRPSADFELRIFFAFEHKILETQKVVTHEGCRLIHAF
jgi:hypothetical protein